MGRRFSKLPVVLALVTTLGLAIWAGLGGIPALSTAPAPPRLVPAILNGNPVNVLYITRSQDTVLVRCYPGFEPSLAVRPMGGDAGQQEGVLTCVNPQ
ncbi:MAG: hypothetical protein HC929_01005 [Leptolyngbyaceae cyanobacterium SM2_5_2]|nr:hypothetical protein [Leptolyngbyaceae cyanobacterium SM2_5_2]